MQRSGLTEEELASFNCSKYHELNEITQKKIKKLNKGLRKETLEKFNSLEMYINRVAEATKKSEILEEREPIKSGYQASSKNRDYSDITSQVWLGTRNLLSERGNLTKKQTIKSFRKIVNGLNLMELSNMTRRIHSFAKEGNKFDKTLTYIMEERGKNLRQKERKNLLEDFSLKSLYERTTKGVFSTFNYIKKPALASTLALALTTIPNVETHFTSLAKNLKNFSILNDKSVTIDLPERGARASIILKIPKGIKKKEVSNLEDSLISNFSGHDFDGVEFERQFDLSQIIPRRKPYEVGVCGTKLVPMPNHILFESKFSYPKISSLALPNLIKLNNAAEKKGFDIVIKRAYSTEEQQKKLHKMYTNRKGNIAAEPNCGIFPRTPTHMYGIGLDVELRKEGIGPYYHELSKIAKSVPGVRIGKSGDWHVTLVDFETQKKLVKDYITRSQTLIASR